MSVSDYMKLPYTRIIQEMNDESGHYYYGKILELDGCQSTGDDINELNRCLDEALELRIESMIDEGMDIPIPTDDKYSGKFLLRIPKSLHKQLALEAEKENVSLNQYVVYKLSHA